MTAKRQAGLTLIELLMAVVVLGFLSIAMSSVFSSFIASMRTNYLKNQEINNRAIGYALLQYAHDSTQTGTLPAPFSGNGYISTVYNPADATVNGLALSGSMQNAGINPNEINNDNFDSHRVRVYQRVTGLVANWPLYFQSGPVVTISYEFGAIYMTACPKTDATCNPNSATGIPGASLVMTPANYGSWVASNSDVAPYTFSTLPLQKQMLASTTVKLDKIRDTFVSFLRASQQTAAGNDTTNWYPPNPVTMSGVNPATNQGCRDGWYDLSAEPSILPAVGMTVKDGVTAWGAPIQYCRDYDPTTKRGPNASPPQGAIRINSSVSMGLAPDAVVEGNNVVLTF